MNGSTTVRGRAVRLAIAFFLVAATLAVFGRAVTFDFVNFDDNLYVTDNPPVQKGLTLEGLRWAFTTGHTVNWYPLTWLSHMLDVELFGLDPAGHHATSVLLHALSAGLLFHVLLRMTGGLWQSALVAGLFALHPLRVESVAWVAERKDVLSTFFWILTMLAYARYAESRTVARYLAVAGCFALGLMAKPMLVTLPFVLLLLDYWPLKRVNQAASEGRIAQRTARLLLEKAPLFALSAAVSIVTFLLQRGEAMTSLKATPMLTRLLNASAAYGTYLAQTFWPTGLAVFYPRAADPLLLRQALLGGALLAAGTLAALGWAKRRPYLAVGWLWYLGTLIPVIGLVQVGAQAHADRYTYLPQIGLFIAVVWGVGGLLAERPVVAKVACAASAIALATCTALTWNQLGHWHNSRVLFQHAVAVTADNGRAHDYLGQALLEEGRTDAAVTHLREAVRLEPYNPQPAYNLGLAYYGQGNIGHAREQFERALQLDAVRIRSHFMLGNLALEGGDFPESIGHFSVIIDEDSENINARINLAIALARHGSPEEAETHFREVIEREPSNADALYNYGLLLIEQARMPEAQGVLERTLQARPDHVEAHRQLGRILRGRGLHEEAERHFNTAAEIEDREESVDAGRPSGAQHLIPAQRAPR